MAAKPTDVPTFADSVTGLARRVDPGSGIREDGYAPGDRPAAQHWDFWMGLIGEWLQYLSDQVFDGDVEVTGGNFITAEADVAHGVRTIRLGPSCMQIADTSPGFTPAGASTAHYEPTLAGSAAGTLIVSLPLQSGERLIGARVLCRSEGSVASDINARLVKHVAADGDLASVATDIVASTDMPAAVTTVQTIVLTPGAPVDTAGVPGIDFLVRVHGNGTAGIKHVFCVEYDVDRV